MEIQAKERFHMGFNESDSNVQYTTIIPNWHQFIIGLFFIPVVTLHGPTIGAVLRECTIRISTSYLRTSLYIGPLQWAKCNEGANGGNSNLHFHVDVVGGRGIQ